jgi:hypothetical protein
LPFVDFLSVLSVSVGKRGSCYNQPKEFETHFIFKRKKGIFVLVEKLFSTKEPKIGPSGFFV